MKLSLEQLSSNFLRTARKIPKLDSEESKGGNYLSTAFSAAIIVCVILQFIPDAIKPFTFMQFWHDSKGSFQDWFNLGKPVFAWGGGVSAFFLLITRNKRSENSKAEGYFVAGMLTSLWAGVMEEICFRWLIFLGNIVTVKLVNFLVFGFFGFGIWEWCHNIAFGPIANWLSRGYLEQYMINPELWFVGASILATNALFRDGHKYQGLFGWLNSWFIGMFFFWVMFNYGLPAAIFIHFTYDLVIDVVKYVDMFVERLFNLGD